MEQATKVKLTRRPTTKDDFRALFEHNFKEDFNQPHVLRNEWLANEVFGIFTYTDRLDEKFAIKMVEVLEAILNRTTYEYIAKSDDNELWFMNCCHFVWLEPKITWGTSIRGAMFDPAESWDCELKYPTKNGYEDINPVKNYTYESGNNPWFNYIQAMIEFSREDKAPFEIEVDE